MVGKKKREGGAGTKEETSMRGVDVEKEPSRDWEKAGKKKLRPRRSNRIETCSMNFSKCDVINYIR